MTTESQILPLCAFAFYPCSVFCILSCWSAVEIRLEFTRPSLDGTDHWRTSTSVENIRQIRLFMQNKAKVKMGKMGNCEFSQLKQ
jgi:hypothetical protein